MRAGEWERARARLEEAISSARTRRRPAVGASRDDRAPVAALVHRAGRGSGGGSARRRGAHPRARADRRPSRAREGVVAPQRAHAIASQWEARADALDEAILHARQSPDEGQLRVLVALYAQALYYGPTPVPEAVRTCSGAARRAPGAPTFEAGLGTTLAGLRAMEGRFDEARELYPSSVAVYEEFGLRFRRAVRTIVGAQIESLAGDPRRGGARAAHRLPDARGDGRARGPLDGGGLPRRRPVVRRARSRRRSGSSRSRAETAAETDVVPQVIGEARSRERRAARRRDGGRGARPRRPSSWPGRRTSSTSEPARSSPSATCCGMPARARRRRRASRRLVRCTSSKGTSRQSGRRAGTRIRRVTFLSGDRPS